LGLLLPVLAVRVDYSDSNEQVISVKITNVTLGSWKTAAKGRRIERKVLWIDEDED
jgi:hypothetical protein